MKPTGGPFKILIIEDEAMLRGELRDFFSLEGFDVLEADAPSRAFALLGKETIDVVLLDVKLPEMDGTEVLRRIKAEHPDLEVIVMTGHGDMETVVSALRGGAADFFRKPFQVEDVTAAIRRTRRFLDREDHLRDLSTDFGARSAEIQGRISALLTENPSMGRILDLTLRAARAQDTSVILLGESGTGKEIVARLLHEAGCFVMPNPWDVGTARILERLGFEALATTSAGFAFSHGVPDNRVGRDAMLAHVAQLTTATNIPVSADLENGYGDWNASIADYRSGSALS